MEHSSAYVLKEGGVMIRAAFQEAVALASVTLFIGMIAVWAEVVGHL
jgi:hypothetical protein